MTRREYPMFYDPGHRRGPIVKVVVGLLGAAVLVLAGSFGWSIISHPDLPAISLGRQPAALPAGSTRAAAFAEPLSCQKLCWDTASPPGGPNESDSPYQPLCFAFLVNWDEAGFNSLRHHLDRVDVLVPQWLHYAAEDGMLIEDEPARRQQVTQMIQEAHSSVHVMPLVTNMVAGQWNGKAVTDMLADASRRQYMVEQLVEFAQTHGFWGINVDFEALPKSAMSFYCRFLEELARRLHEETLQLSVSVPFEADDFDYRRVAAAADHVVVMAYDEHWTDGPAGPIAGAPWLAGGVERLKESIPAKKMVLALGSYAYDWPERGRATVKSIEETLSTARQANVPVASEANSLNAAFAYANRDGQTHHVWMLDAVAAFNAIAIFRPAHPAGLALWRLGTEDPSIWELLGRPVSPTAEVAGRLCRISPRSVLYEGQGEVLDLADRARDGARELWYDGNTHWVRAERYGPLPTPCTIARHGFSPHGIALTFDDGPDPAYTPGVLSILREAGIKATFFVIGSNCQQHPDLLRREVQEGHEIGNHTFTHPDISSIAPWQFTLELSACQRTLEALIGRHTVLFRPPYSRDLNPSAPEDLGPLEQVHDLGYLAVSSRIDTADWTNPGVPRIVSDVLDQADGGGRIVIMHDSGGDRRQMLEALPEVIVELRRRGYEFVTVSQLLGLDPRQVMPQLTMAQGVLVRSNLAAMGLLNSGLEFVCWIFMFGLVLGLTRMVLIATGAILHRRQARRRDLGPLPALTLSVIVPAHNEEKLVVSTVQALLASEGVEEFEILVVDDGSTDGTYQAVVSAFAGSRRVKAFTKPNGGKSSALNFGLARSKSDIVIMLDADTIFEPDTIRLLLRHFADGRVGAVAGNVRVGNRINPLTQWQALEYITSQSLDRRALTTINCNTVVPGAVGAWRRDLVLRAGMLNHRTLAEDADLTVAICRMGYRIEYDYTAVAHTEAPDTLSGFLRQRFRWMFGTFQVLAKNLSALGNPRCSWLGFVGMPNMLLFQVFFPLMAPAMDLVVLVALVMTAYAGWHSAPGSSHSARQFILYYMLFLTVDTLSAALALYLEGWRDRWLLLWVPVQRVFYRFTMYYIGVKSIFAALSGRAVGWGSLIRKATVAAGAEPASVPVAAEFLELAPAPEANPWPAAISEIPADAPLRGDRGEAA